MGRIQAKNRSESTRSGDGRNEVKSTGDRLPQAARRVERSDIKKRDHATALLFRKERHGTFVTLRSDIRRPEPPCYNRRRNRNEVEIDGAERSQMDAKGTAKRQAKRNQTRMAGGVGGAGSIPVPTRFCCGFRSGGNESVFRLQGLGEHLFKELRIFGILPLTSDSHNRLQSFV